jgi:hypothetical protein
MSFLNIEYNLLYLYFMHVIPLREVHFIQSNYVLHGNINVEVCVQQIENLVHNDRHRRF